MKHKHVISMTFGLLLASAFVACSDDDENLSGGSGPVVSLDKTEVELDMYGTAQLNVTIEPADAPNKEFFWSRSSDAATVDSTGLVTPLEIGETELTITMVDGGHSATCKVTVVQTHVESIALDRTSLVLEEGGSSKHLTATVLPEEAQERTVIWSSEDESVATVNERGDVFGHKLGKTRVVATTVDGGIQAFCDVEVVELVDVEWAYLIDMDMDGEIDESWERVEGTPPSLYMGVGDTFQIMLDPDDLDYQFTSLNPSVATVDENGLITFLSEGDVTILISVGAKEASWWFEVYEY